ncbi:hypothetical protein RI054_27g112250 [Pseudoscourfieldia marina]
MLDHLPLCLYHKIVAMATRPADDAHSDGDRAAVACLRATCKSLRRAHAEDDALAVRFGVTNAVESINRLEWALKNCTWAGPKASTSWDCKHSEQQHSESINSHAIFRRKPSWFNLSSLSSSSGDDSLIPTTPTTQESRAVSTSGVPVSCFRFVSAAALRGRTEVLRHLRSQYGAVYDERTAYAAVKGGHLDTLLEVRQAGCPLGDMSKLCEAAAKHGHLKVLKHLVEVEGCLWDKWTARTAIEEGHLHVVKYLLEELGCPVDEGCSNHACQGGQLHVLRWLRDVHKCPWNEGSFFAAARQGHLNILNYLHENGCPWNESACQGAARGGHLSVLKWLRSRNCPWNAWTTRAALEGGHIEVFWWCRSGGCPYEEDGGVHHQLSAIAH